MGETERMVDRPRVPEPIVILIAEDDPEDRLLIQRAIDKIRLANDIRFVEDGNELLDYLRHKGAYADRKANPEPGMVLLDLNMPRKDGREALKEIKADPAISRIPVVVLTTSDADVDIAMSYANGANSFITKPVSMDGLVKVMATLKEYWFEIVRLPSSAHHA